ncbi:uncharacterized protein METZ01_LOCUS293011, partial [marine metagenome]
MKNNILIAPMMNWTDRHCRYFMRLLSSTAKLFTEMVTAHALEFGNAERLLQFDPIEHPVALQLGGCDPQLMVSAAKLAEAKGYDEININVGCPSDRVQQGQFGACLMSTPGAVAACVKSMLSAVDVPVTIKTRIGIDANDGYSFLRTFVQTNIDAGCRTFIVHARKAILEGLSPKDNRTIPPLIYERVYSLKQEFPELTIVINGGITTIEECHRHLELVDGVMIGRQAYHRPWFLTELEANFGAFGRQPTRLEIIEK